MTQSVPSVKLFTLAEANAMLPLVRAIALDLARLSQEVLERQQRLELLTVGREEDASSTAGEDPYRDELRLVAQELEKEHQQLREYVAELRQLGIRVQEPLRGRVAFPAWLRGELGGYSWELGEAEVMFWQGRDERRSPRRPLCKEENAI
jgi:hypothetical protein